jgi:hypothetical protein
MARVIQIAVAPAYSDDSTDTLYVLLDDGSIHSGYWANRKFTWDSIPSPVTSRPTPIKEIA